MESGPGSAAVSRLTAYFETIGSHFPRRKRRESSATCFFGILSDGEWKSVELIAARACGDPHGTKRSQDRLLHLLGQNAWSDKAVRREAARHAIAEMTEHAPVTTWIIDDTGSIEQGAHAVGVPRQYIGSAGKLTNCQVGVSLSDASRTEHVDFALYLAKMWLDSPSRRHEAGIPAETTAALVSSCGGASTWNVARYITRRFMSVILSPLTFSCVFRST